MSEEAKRNQRKMLQGVVVSDRMDKTISVRVDTMVKDAKYGKFVRRSQKFMAHDEKNEANIGDLVSLMETRKLSRNKCFRLAEVLEKAK